MDISVLYSIDPSLLETIFGWDIKQVREEVSRMASIIDLKDIRAYKSTRTASFEKLFYNIAEMLFAKTKEKDMIYENYDDIPDDMEINVVYIKNKTIATSAYGEVHTNVYYNFDLCVLKIFKDDTQPYLLDNEEKLEDRYYHTTDMFELITQLYLYQTCQSYVSIPKLIFVRRKDNETHACMEFVQYPFFKDLSPSLLLIALAHLMKTLFLLQKKIHFMHRDLHDENVAYDHQKKRIHLIDFGMSCVNPSKHSIAWQANENSFYPMVFNSLSAKCNNPSLDVCTIISSCAKRHDFLKEEHRQMKLFGKKILNTNKNHVVYKELKKRDDNQYTHITRNWKIGNRLEGNDGQTFWVYNMGEVRLIPWYPEHMLKRLLTQIPFAEWIHIRQNFSKYFDQIMPTLKVKVGGEQGTIIKCVGRKIKIQFDKGPKRDIAPSRIVKISTK